MLNKAVQLAGYLKALFYFRGYRPQPVTIRSIRTWLDQFDPIDRNTVLRLLYHIVYFSHKEIEQLLVNLNNRLLEKLEADGIPPHKIIYVQLHDAGSSSAAMLNMLRNRGHLERKRCLLVDSSNVRLLNELTGKIEQGAIVYVDDFSASGSQFCGVRDFIARFVVGSFPEFFLLPAMCEEAHAELAKRGVEVMTELIHEKSARPLHPNSSRFPDGIKQKLVQISKSMGGLGFRGLATMVIFSHNSPNTLPAILRGNSDDRRPGLFPRTSDIS